MITGINSEDRLVQRTFAEHLENVLGWESVYAYNDETFGPHSLLGRSSEREVVLVRDLRAVVALLNPSVPASAQEQAVEKLIRLIRELLSQVGNINGITLCTPPVGDNPSSCLKVRYDIQSRPALVVLHIAIT